MLNYKELRRDFKEIRTGVPIWPFLGVLGLVVAFSLVMVGCACASQPITDQNITKAILGEAIGEYAEGQEAVARAILNRGNLKGVFGLKNPIIDKATPNDWKSARQAIQMARTRDITGGAIGWGNSADLVIFKRQAWFKRCVITKKIGNHFFYKQKGT